MAQKKGCLNSAASCLVMLIASFLVLNWLNCIKDADWTMPELPELPRVPPWHERQNVVGAYFATQGFVSARLEFPESAEWPGDVQGSQHVVPWDDQHYTIRSWVTSQNAFGVPVRHQYLAKIIQVADDQWQLESLVVDGK